MNEEVEEQTFRPAQCPNCDSPLSGEEKFCGKCGLDLRESETAADAADEPDDRTRWVAEVWVDPEWYRTQSSPDQLPSPGQPQIIGLRDKTVLIGRPTATQPDPQINCTTDSGVSRQHARLISDGTRWWVEDAGSSNGTFVGVIDAELPSAPISQRTEIGPQHRIYVGSWTRIVVRAALVQESDM